MRSNIIGGRGCKPFVRIQRVASPTVAAPTPAVSAADLAAREAANKAAAAASAKRFRESLVAKGVIRPTAKR